MKNARGQFQASSFGRLSGRLLRVTLAGVMFVLLPPDGALAQAPRPEPPTALRFFLTEAPPASVLSEPPPYARRAFVAKVRVLSIRHTAPPEWPSGLRPASLPVYALRAELEVTAPVAGAYVWWRRQRVEFGPVGVGVPRSLRPLPPERDAREYFVVSFLDQDGTRTPLGFPASQEEFEAWRRELNGFHAK